MSLISCIKSIFCCVPSRPPEAPREAEEPREEGSLLQEDDFRTNPSIRIIHSPVQMSPDFQSVVKKELGPYFLPPLAEIIMQYAGISGLESSDMVLARRQWRTLLEKDVGGRENMDEVGENMGDVAIPPELGDVAIPPELEDYILSRRKNPTYLTDLRAVFCPRQCHGEEDVFDAFALSIYLRGLSTRNISLTGDYTTTSEGENCWLLPSIVDASQSKEDTECEKNPSYVQIALCIIGNHLLTGKRDFPPSMLCNNYTITVTQSPTNFHVDINKPTALPQDTQSAIPHLMIKKFPACDS